MRSAAAAAATVDAVVDESGVLEGGAGVGAGVGVGVGAGAGAEVVLHVSS